MDEEQAKDDTEDDDDDDDGDENKASESEDEGIDEGPASDTDNHIDSINSSHAVLTKDERVTEEQSPILQDVLMSPTHLHLPGYEEVEALALLLMPLADDSDNHMIPPLLRNKLVTAASALHEHDRSAKKFIKRYESKWGYTLFGRCLGKDSPLNSAVQKTKFAMRYPQAAEITDESRLLYVVIKMLKNRPKVAQMGSPTKAAATIKGQYKRIVDRVRDDPVLSGINLPLPNINAKSITSFMTKQEKRANYLATTVPKAPSYRKVVSDAPVPDATTLPTSLPIPDRPQMQYAQVDYEVGKRRGEKRRLNFDSADNPQVIHPQSSSSSSASTSSHASASCALRPLLCKPQIEPKATGVPIMLVVPSQPKAQSVSFPSTSGLFQYTPPPPPPPKSNFACPNASKKPCAACHKPNCGGLRKRYTPSKAKTEGSQQKIFTFCPTTNRSITPGFEGVLYDNYDHFKKVVDEELVRRKSTE